MPLPPASRPAPPAQPKRKRETGEVYVPDPVYTRDGTIRKTKPGSGRIPKAQTYQSQIRSAEDLIADKLPNVAEALIDLALGVFVWETPTQMAERLARDPGGSRQLQRIYHEPPNLRAAQYLMDRIAGRPVERKPEEDKGDDRPLINIYLPDNSRAFVSDSGSELTLPDARFEDSEFELPKVLPPGSDVYNEEDLSEHEAVSRNNFIEFPELEDVEEIVEDDD